MANCPLTLRITKGSKLTFAELDGNFISLANCISSLPQYDSFVTGGTYNISTNSVDFTGNFDFIPFSTDLSYLANMDITVTGGTYNPSTGTVTFYNNSGGTFQVSGFLTGYTNYYTTGVTLNNTTLEFDRTDLSNAYSVDLSSLIFTGNTSGNCITDLHVSNLYGCSPITIHDNLVIESGLTISSSNGGGQIELDYALQPSNILISTDNGGSSESFVNLQPTELNLGSLNGDVRIQSSNSNSFRSGNLFSNRSQILMEPDFVKIGVVDPSAVFSNDYESVVVYNTRSSDQATSNANKWPVTVSSKNSTILSGVRNSVILGGSDITATTNNTVYVDNLNIKTIGGGTSVINLGLDVNGNVVTGVTSNSGIFGISNSGGAYTYYSTLSSAMSAATAGQTIEMFADVTETGAVTITLKNGVNINGNGHTYTYTNTANDCFIDNGVAVDCQILNLKVTRQAATSTGHIFSITSVSTRIDFTGSYLFYNVTTPGSFYALYNSGAATILNAYAISTGSALYSLNSTTGRYINCYGQSTGSGVGISGNNIINSVGISVSGFGISVENGGTCMNSIGISTTSTGISGQLIRNSIGLSTSGDAINGLLVYDSYARSSSGRAIAGFANQGQYYNCSVETDSNNVTNTNLAKVYNCSCITNWNNTAGHCLSRVDVVVNSYLKVTNASANCIHYSSALTCKYSNNTFDGATTPVNANITQGIINTQDNQGNILL